MITRYLRDGHHIYLQLELERMVQRRGLREYVEQFQQLDVALRLTQASISEKNKVLKFVQGLQTKRNRLHVLHSHPQTLNDAYKSVNVICQSNDLSVLLSPENRSKTTLDSRPTRRGRRNHTQSTSVSESTLSEDFS